MRFQAVSRHYWRGFHTTMRKTCWSDTFGRSIHSSGCPWLSVSHRHFLSAFVLLRTWSFLQEPTWGDRQDPVSHKGKAEDRARTEAEDAPSVHQGNSSSNQDRSSPNSNRCSHEDEVEVDGNREEVDQVHSAHSVGAGATFGNSAQ